MVVAVVVILGGFYWYYTQNPPAAPAGQAGLNGSPNQGNTGGDLTGTVQQPGADGAEGSIIGANLALGTDSNATLGKYLVAYNGMTLYTYSKDTAGHSNCTGQCAVNWPPYIAGPEDNVNQLQAGVTGKADTIVRADGTAQVTYNGMPLYFYVNDHTSGDTTGQGVGGVWYVVKP